MDFRANMNASSGLGGEGFSGRAHGTYGCEYNKTFIYPSNFDSSSPERADATDNSVGFGITGKLNIALNGMFNTALDSNGFTGSLNCNVSGTCDMLVKWPNWGWWYGGAPALTTYNVTASTPTPLTVEKTDAGVRAYGAVYFSSTDSSGKVATQDASFDVTLNGGNAGF